MHWLVSMRKKSPRKQNSATDKYEVLGQSGLVQAFVVKNEASGYEYCMQGYFRFSLFALLLLYRWFRPRLEVVQTMEYTTDTHFINTVI